MDRAVYIAVPDNLRLLDQEGMYNKYTVQVGMYNKYTVYWNIQ